MSVLFLVESEILNHEDRIEQFMLTERRKAKRHIDALN